MKITPVSKEYSVSVYLDEDERFTVEAGYPGGKSRLVDGLRVTGYELDRVNIQGSGKYLKKDGSPSEQSFYNDFFARAEIPGPIMEVITEALICAGCPGKDWTLVAMQLPSVMAAVKDARKVQAIRELRIATGLGLIEAKNTIEDPRIWTPDIEAQYRHHLGGLSSRGRA
jgi:hypothetical protein